MLDKTAGGTKAGTPGSTEKQTGLSEFGADAVSKRELSGTCDENERKKIPR